MKENNHALPVLPAPRYRVELIKERNSHKYVIDGGIVLPGVTGILGIIAKPALINWAKRETLNTIHEGLVQLLGGRQSANVEIGMDFISKLIEAARANPDKIKEEAANLGTQAHAYIDKVVNGMDLEYLPGSILRPVSAFADWWKSSGLRFVLGDTKVASRVHGYGGSLDALAADGGRLVVLDWKTSKALYDEYALQVAAYVKAFEEMYGASIGEAWCVRFSKPGVLGPAFEAIRVRNIDESFAAFLDAKGLAEKMKLEHFVRETK